MNFTIAPIVEGHGDVAALPVLIRKLLPGAAVARPVRFPRSRLTGTEGHLERAVRIAAANIAERGLVLLVVDADESCAATLGPELLGRMRSGAGSLPCIVAIPVREFEAWIVGGIESYGVMDPDSGDLKGRIKDSEGQYLETVDQPRLSAAIDVELLYGRSRSFRHFADSLRRTAPGSDLA
ncbi:hypothetical protein PHYC_02287 [Phycisphaerales bacterium]|nr:hypothetical protein PHYC_02287 [Phycisphaerales bacterium]